MQQRLRNIVNMEQISYAQQLTCPGSTLWQPISQTGEMNNGHDKHGITTIKINQTKPGWRPAPLRTYFEINQERREPSQLETALSQCHQQRLSTVHTVNLCRRFVYSASLLKFSMMSQGGFESSSLRDCLLSEMLRSLPAEIKIKQCHRARHSRKSLAAVPTSAVVVFAVHSQHCPVYPHFQLPCSSRVSCKTRRHSPVLTTPPLTAIIERTVQSTFPQSSVTSQITAPWSTGFAVSAAESLR